VTDRRSHSLDGVRADGWFEKLGDEAPQFGQLCEAVGERVVAFAIIAGVRIVSVTVDRQVRDASRIEFTLGEDDEVHHLELGELRRRLGATLVADEPTPTELSEDPSDEELQAFIGFRYLLLAPLFGVKLRELRIGGDGPGVVVDLGGAVDEVGLDELRTLIRERVRAESKGAERPSPFSIDLGAVPRAEKTNEAGDWEGTIANLGGWPGPLSLLLRTAEGQQLTSEVKGTLAHALGLLGTAYANVGNFDWAEEVMRLGIQWGQESGGRAAAELFLRLGATHLKRGRHGQAIGLLRRALVLGAPEGEVLPHLARCFAARERHLATAVCVEQARALGVDDEGLDPLFDEAVEALGDPWTRFRALVAAPACDRQTWRPPPA